MMTGMAYRRLRQLWSEGTKHIRCVKTGGTKAV